MNGAFAIIRTTAALSSSGIHRPERNFIVCVKVENFPDEILDYSDSFDPDEHIAMWIEAKQNGTKGVPGARQIVHDAEEIEKELDELAFELQEAERKLWLTDITAHAAR